MEDVIDELQGLINDLEFGSATRNHVVQTLENAIEQLNILKDEI